MNDGTGERGAPRVRCVVVGLGAITEPMLESFSTRGWYETVALVDVSAAALQRWRERLPGVPTFTDLGDALESVEADAVIVNTPSELHHEQALRALAAGRHVLVAKPITNDFDDAVDLVEAARTAGVTLAVGQQMRYMRHYRAVARFVRAGGLGELASVVLLNAKPRPDPANLAAFAHPALYETSCHHFDSLLAVVGDRRPAAVSCDAYRPPWSRYAGPCSVNAWIRFEDGLRVLYHGGFSAQAPNYELRLEGTGGALRCRGIHMSNDEMTNELAPPNGTFAPSDLDADLPPSRPWEPFADDWYAYLRGGPEPSFGGRENLKVFALLSAAIESADAGGVPVEVATHPRFGRAFDDAAERALVG